MKRFLSVLAVGFLLATSSNIAFGDDVMPKKSPSGDFIPGTGIPGDNFTTSVTAGGEALSLKARSRDSGQALSIVGNRYTLLPGMAVSDPTKPWWNFDWQFAPGGLPQSAYTLKMDVDFDPAAGAANFVTISQSVSTGWTAQIINNPGGGQWSDSRPYVVADSWNLGFAFWNTLGANPPYNPNTDPFEYEIKLTVIVDGVPIATDSIFAVSAAAVPEPTTWAMIGVVALGTGGYAWRKRRAHLRALAA